jgi:hypothetical protein
VQKGSPAARTNSLERGFIENIQTFNVKRIRWNQDEQTSS